MDDLGGAPDTHHRVDAARDWRDLVDDDSDGLHGGDLPKILERDYELNIIPKELTFENYLFIFKNTPFGTGFLSSSVTSSLVTVSVLFFDLLIGYTLAKFEFRGATSFSSLS